MINKFTTRFVYLTPLKWVTVMLSVLLGAPFCLVGHTGPLTVADTYCLAYGFVFALPIVAVLHTLRQGNKFWRMLGECRELLSEAQNLSDVNWIRNGHYQDLQGMLGSAKTREANLMQVAELHRLSMDIEQRHHEIMGYYLER